jgi:hypothetical protein
MARRSAEGGQASVELVAIVPILLLVTLLTAQLALAGYGLWSAGVAARAGARAAYVGGDAEGAARSALPLVLRGGASVSDRDGVGVRVEVPSLVPGVSGIPVTARTRIGTGDAAGR